jgi:hypothetical protein
LLGRTREITSNELILWQDLTIWNQCVVERGAKWLARALNQISYEVFKSSFLDFLI